MFYFSVNRWCSKQFRNYVEAVVIFAVFVISSSSESAALYGCLCSALLLLFSHLFVISAFTLFRVRPDLSQDQIAVVCALVPASDFVLDLESKTKTISHNLSCNVDAFNVSYLQGNLFSIYAILAVDFPIFPRDLAKTEVAGVSIVGWGFAAKSTLIILV